MKFTKRQVQILHYLNEYRETTIKQISQKIGVTGQTIKVEIMALEEILKTYGINIEFHSGRGIKVEGGNHLQELLKISETNIEFSVKEQILLLLVLSRDYLVLQDIADKLFISKSQVEKLMPTILKNHEGEIQSTRHYGYCYSGTEMNRRTLFVDLISPYMGGTDIKKRFDEFDESHFPIKKYFDKEVVEKSLEIWKYILGLEVFTFIDDAIKQLFLELLFMLKTSNKDIVVMSQDLLEKIKKIGEFKLYKERITEMNKVLGLSLMEDEKDYLAYLCMILKKKKSLNKEEILLEMKDFVQRLLEIIKTKLFTDLTQDTELVEGLSYHIYTTILKGSTPNHTPDSSMWLEIKRHYPLGYEIGTLAVELINEEYDYIMDEQELIYLALHFQAAIEKLKQVEERIKAIIVCHFGVAVSNLISRRIERIFPQIDVIATYSVQDFIKLEDVQCDLIMSTESLPNTDITTLYVTPALKDVEIGCIREFVSTRNAKKLIANEIKDAIIIHFEAPISQEKMISEMVGQLEEYVLPQYLESVYEREAISSTEMEGIAVPHGNPKYVKRMKLVIGRVNDPVKWYEEKVKYIFLLAIPGELLQQNSRVFTNFYKKISDLEFEIDLNELDEKEDEDLRKFFIKWFR